MNSTETHYLTVSLNPDADEWAKQFASQQLNEDKKQQVYFNTLAVYAVHKFVQEIGFETNLAAGDSWHSVIRMVHDVADLVIPKLGKIECRVLMPEDTAISLPAEVTEDRIAYVAVRVKEQLNRVELLGFVRATDVYESATTLEFDQLEPIENLIDYLFRLESGMEVLQEKSEVDERVWQRVETTPMFHIIAQLERIVRQEPEYEWRRKGGKIFLSDLIGAAGIERELREVDEDEEIAAQDLAEDLLEKLAEIWSEEG
jgi:hypothetical protein